MSSKLDQSLDEIAGGRGRGRGGRRRGLTRKTAAAPAGGVAKRAPAPKPTKGAKPTPTGPAVPTRGDSKIIVSNLPEDVTEQQIKEYFSSTVGHVRRVLLNYTKTGRSTGVANIIFSQPNSAAEAAKSYNGVKVDNKPMKIEVVMGAQFVPEPAAPKTLKDRIATPKSAAAKPKAATNGKAAPNKPAAAGAASTRGNANKRGRGGRKARPARKTAEELDADMADYFVAGTNGAPATEAAAAPNGGETVMEDEVL